MTGSILFITSVPMVFLLFLMIVSMPETFIRPIQTTLLGLYLLFK